MEDFIGSDPLQIKVERKLISSVIRCGTNDECRQKNTNNGWSGTVYVNYTYAVPEPSTLMLLGMGLIGLGAGRMRKRNA
jgi:threonine dehydrogenase-like Zn-dependent dehydrogenase